MIRDLFDGKQTRFAELGKWWSITSAFSLMLAAATGVVYDLFHKSLAEAFPQLPGPELVLIGLVSFLCFGLGAERFLTLRKIENDFEKASRERATLLDEIRTVSTKLGVVEPLIGPGAIERAALKLVEDCDHNDRIKATGQYRLGDELSGAYFRALANRVKRARDQGGNMDYQVVIPCSPSSGKDDDERQKVFVDCEVGTRIDTRYNEHPWPFEILIGGHSIIVALRGGKRATYEVAVKITDSYFVEKATEWFNEAIWQEAASAPGSTKMASSSNVKGS